VQGDTLDLQVEEAVACLSGSECFGVGLLSATQAQAKFASLSATAFGWPAGKVWPQTVSFDVPPDTTGATFDFNGVSVPLELEGDRVPLPVIEVLAPAPTPAAAANEGTAGYFVHTDYGIAISRVSGQRSSELANWKVIRVDLSLISQAGRGLGEIAWNEVDGQTCFTGVTGNECLALEWSDVETFEGALTFLEEDTPLASTGSLERPRGLSQNFSVMFVIPEDSGEATLVFGGNRIELDVRGMAGTRPPWAYRSLYPELAAGTEVFRFGSKTVVLRSIVPAPVDGDVILIFDAAQGVGETGDFRPGVSIAGSRITGSGKVIDGLSAGTSANSSFTPTTVSVTPPAIAPGGSTSFELLLPRVVSDDFAHVGFSEDRPDVVIASITVSDALSTAPTPATPAALVNFVRDDDEERFWLPDLVVESMAWSPKILPSTKT
jgi:hypothetical protein